MIVIPLARWTQESALDEHVSPDAARFAAAVFSLHDTNEIEELVRRARFADVRLESAVGRLAVPPPAE